MPCTEPHAPCSLRPRWQQKRHIREGYVPTKVLNAGVPWVGGVVVAEPRKEFTPAPALLAGPRRRVVQNQIKEGLEHGVSTQEGSLAILRWVAKAPEGPDPWTWSEPPKLEGLCSLRPNLA